MRTPAIQSSDGRRMVGLQNYKNIIEFFQGQTVNSPENQPTSRHKERQTIAVFGEDACHKLWNVLVHAAGQLQPAAAPVLAGA